MRTDRIAHLYADPGPFASVLVDVSRDTETGEHELALRAGAVRDGLREEGAPDTVVEALADRLTDPLHRPAPTTRALVATDRGVLFDESVHARTDDVRVAWDALPDVTGWLALEQGSVPFVLVLVDHTGGDVATYRSASLDPSDAELAEAGGETEHAHKVPGGGWSHLRYQNTTENVWHHNAKEVAEEVRRHLSAGYRLVLLAGEPDSRSDVRRMIGDASGAEVVELHSGSRAKDGGDEALRDAVSEVLREAVTARQLETVRELQERLGRGRAVASGIDEVSEAFTRGQVETVLLNPELAAAEVLSTRDHPGLVLGAATGTQRPFRADRALVAAAALTGAQVETYGRGVLRGQPAAALLRWDDTATPP